MLAGTLRRHGFAVRLATEGADAPAQCRTHQPDVVFLDPLVLSWHDGLQVCRRLRRSCPAAVILVTARCLDSDIRAGFAAGADAYICKPFSPRDLLARVQAVLERRPGPPLGGARRGSPPFSSNEGGR